MGLRDKALQLTTTMWQRGVDAGGRGRTRVDEATRRRLPRAPTAARFALGGAGVLVGARHVLPARHGPTSGSVARPGRALAGHP